MRIFFQFPVKNLKTLGKLRTAVFGSFQVQNSFQQYFSCFMCLKKKFISGKSELIYDIAIFCSIMVVFGDFL